MSYSLQSLRGALYRPMLFRGIDRGEWTGLRFDVTRFGAGYWIGAICSTLIGVAFSLLSQTSHGLGETILFTFVGGAGYGILLTMLIGAILAGLQIPRAIHACDRNALIGGLLGFLLCTWPYLLLIGQIIHLIIMQAASPYNYNG